MKKSLTKFFAYLVAKVVLSYFFSCVFLTEKLSFPTIWVQTLINTCYPLPLKEWNLYPIMSIKLNVNRTRIHQFKTKNYAGMLIFPPRSGANGRILHCERSKRRRRSHLCLRREAPSNIGVWKYRTNFLNISLRKKFYK